MPAGRAGGRAPRFVTYSFIRVGSALSRSGLPDIDYALNPYVGCAHGCAYCYARTYTRDPEVVRSWGRLVRIKVNLLEALLRDVGRLKPGVVGVATITDPYQPVEASEQLTRRSLTILLRSGFRVDIQTKSPLVLRDIDILRGWGGRVEVGLTITTLDDTLAAVIEPGAPPPTERASALRELSAAGISTWVFLGPIIPEVNDAPESIAEVVKLARETGSQLIYDHLRLKPQMIGPLTQALRELGLNHERVLKLASSRRWVEEVAGRVMSACREEGADCVPAF